MTPAFLLIALSTLAYFVAEGALIPTVPRYVEGPLGGGESAVGIVVGAFAVTALLFRPWAGRLADRRGRRFVMLVGMVVFAASVAGYVVAESIPLMVVMRLMTGAGAAFFFVGAATAVTDLAPEARRGEAISFFSLSLYAGVGAGPVLGEVAVSSSGFDLAWWLIVGASVLAFVLAVPVPDTRPPERSEGRMRIVHPAAVVPGLVILASIWGMAGFFAFTPLYVERLGLEDSRFVFLLFSGVVLLIRGFGAKLPDRLGPGRAARAALTASALALLVIGTFESTPGLLIGTAILGVGVGLAFPALMSMTIANTKPAERGAAVGTFSAFVDLAFGVGPLTLGYVAEALGLRSVYFTAAGVALLGLVMLAVRRRRRLGPRRRRRRAEPEFPVPEIPA
ncbi:MAG TPA: MFS transporter [Actinomycetota bacterium]